MRRACLLMLGALLFHGLLAAQEQKQEQKEQKKEPPLSKPAPVSPYARMTLAKTVYVKNAGGSRIPCDVISSALDGWGRYTVVDDPAKADLIVEVSSPEEGGGVAVSSTMTRDTNTGRPVESATTTRDLSSGAIRMLVRDARTSLPLWSGSEHAKSALRQKAREDNLVQAAERLVSKFRQRVEPGQ